MVYLVESLVLKMNENDARKYFEQLIDDALNSLLTRVNNAVHILVHPTVKEDV